MPAEQGGRYGAYSAPNPEPGTVVPGPGSGTGLDFLQTLSRRGLRIRLVIPRAGRHYAAQRMQSIRENKKNGNGENEFSPVPFFVFGWPVAHFNRFLK